METLWGSELESFRVQVKAFTPRYRCRWPERVPGRLCVLLGGSMLESEVRYTASDVVYKPPEDRPRLSFGDAGCRTLTVELRRGGVDILRSVGFDVEAPFSARSPLCYTLAERARRELRDGDEMTPLVLEGLVLDLFTKTHRLKKKSGAPPWLLAVRERIESEFALPRTLRDYARDVGIHPVELASRFRHHYGCSVGEHIRAVRVRRAMHELAHTGKPIAEIALETGFCDQSHLSRVFKKQTGVSPAEFRRSA